jgi:beta-lactam-binding protein with PASTA domain
VAAPVFADIINRLVHMVPDEESEPELLPMIAEKDSQVPDFLGMVFTSVEEVLVEKDIDYSIKGEGSFVIKQEMDEDEVVLTLGEVVVSGKKIPDMRGLTVREALGKIDFSRATVRIEGSGKVVKQSLRPGAEWSRNSTLILSCSE